MADVTPSDDFGNQYLVVRECRTHQHATIDQ
jgi:hypothetical protein